MIAWLLAKFYCLTHGHRPGWEVVDGVYHSVCKTCAKPFPVWEREP